MSLGRYEELRDKLLKVSDTVVFGQGPDVDVVVNDPYVSRRHCRIGCTDGEWWIEDLGSTNGTRIIARSGPSREVTLMAKLSPGDRIEIGHTILPWEVPA